MSRVFITGCTEGLGRAAAQTLMRQGHEVVLHARSRERASSIASLAAHALGVVIGDLASATETRSVAEQVNTIGAMDAVIHNAGIYRAAQRDATPEGHPRTLAVNTLAPYVLTALIKRPARLIYLSSAMHTNGEGSLPDIDWRKRRWNDMQAYCETKLHVAALAAALSKRWPDTISNAVDPGWVPTRMGGPSAPDDLEQGHLTQTWLAVGSDRSAETTGGYWRHHQKQRPASEVLDVAFQADLLSKLAELTGVNLSG